MGRLRAWIAKHGALTGTLVAVSAVATIMLWGDPPFVVLAPGVMTIAVLGVIAIAEDDARTELSLPQGRYPSLFERLTDAMLVVRQDRSGALGRIERVNAAAARLFERSEEELAGTAVSDLLPSLLPALKGSFAAQVDERGAVASEHTVWLGGERKTVALQFYPIVSTKGRRILLVVKDLADREIAERALSRRERQLAQLTTMTRTINATLERGRIVRRLAESARVIVHGSTALVGLVEDEVLVFTEYVDVDGVHPLDVRLGRGDCVPGRVWDTLTPYMTNDAARDLAPCPVFDELFRPVNLLAVPILSGDGTFIGCVAVHDKADGEPFDEEDTIVVLGLASSAAIAIENAAVLQDLLLVRSELLGQREDLRRLAGELSRTEERERRRIAEELHDRIGQELAVIRMKLVQVFAAQPRLREEPAYQQMSALVDQTIADTRTLTFEISPPMLYTLGLAPTLEWLAEQLERQHGLAISVTQDDGSLTVSDDIRGLLYVCARELLMNVVKHADASSAEVRITGSGEGLRISVIDDGVGYVPAKQAHAFGLFSIRERLADIGGTLEVRTAEDGGTEAVIEVPRAGED